MKRTILAIVGVLTLAAICQAQAVRVPKFSKYSAVVEKPRAKSVDFRHDAGARSYRTRLSAAFRGGVNFAGHYIITGWGCGTGCTNGAVIDTRTGKVYWPVQLYNLDASYGNGYSERQVEFRRNSRLMIIHGRPGTGDENAEAPPSGDYYYEWRNNRFRLLKFVEKRSE